jgi:hypothetical protein
MRAALSLTLALSAAAASAGQPPAGAPPPKATQRISSQELSDLIGHNFIRVIRAFGPPSAVEQPPAAPGVPNAAGDDELIWIYRRPNAIRLEFLIDAGVSSSCS